MSVHVLVFIINIVLGQIIYEDLLLLGMLIEVLFKALIRHKLFLELIDFLSLYRLVVKSADYILDPGLNLDEFLPQYRNAFDHVRVIESFLHFPLVELKCLDFFRFRGLYQSQRSTVVCIDLGAILFESIVFWWGIEVYHIRNCLKLGLLGVA